MEEKSKIPQSDKDQQALLDRLSGRLTTVDIAGHTFYVDLPMDCLRPHDDFLSRGIQFRDIDDCYNDEEQRYEFPYNPKTHEFEQVDFERMTSIPDNIVFVAIPGAQTLDPVGYARKGGWDMDSVLKETPQKAHFKADVIAWKDTFLPALVKENKQRIEKEEPKQSLKRPHRRGKGI